MFNFLSAIFSVDIAEFLKTIATNCSEGLAWLLGITGTVGFGTIIGAIIAIVKNKVQAKELVSLVNKGNSANLDYIKEYIEQAQSEINEATDEVQTTLNKFGSDNALIGELLLMLASKMGFSNDEIVKIANKYKELGTATESVADNIISEVEETNAESEATAQAEALKAKASVESVSSALENLKDSNTETLKISL